MMRLVLRAGLFAVVLVAFLAVAALVVRSPAGAALAFIGAVIGLAALRSYGTGRIRANRCHRQDGDGSTLESRS